MEIDPSIVEEIGVEGAKKWRRDVKHQKYMELWKKTQKKTAATEKRLAEVKAKGELDPLFVKHQCPCEEQPIHMIAQWPERGFDLIFWNPNKVGKPYAQVLVRDLEFEDEQHSRRLILYPAWRTTDKGMTYFRDFQIKQDFRGRYNTWWSNFFQAHCHKEGCFLLSRPKWRCSKIEFGKGIEQNQSGINLAKLLNGVESMGNGPKWQTEGAPNILRFSIYT